MEESSSSIELWTTIVTAGAAIIALGISVWSNWLYRIHSSPKPFIKLDVVLACKHTIDPPEGTPTEVSPKIHLQNIGPGIALNTLVKSSVRCKSGQKKTVQFLGPNVIFPDGESNIYFTLEDVFLLEVTDVSITYQSDSGYSRTTKWRQELIGDQTKIIHISSK